MKNSINYKYDESKIANQLLEMMGAGLFSTEEMKKTERKIKRMLCYYQCALMETETKFRVLNEEFSLRHERNPISTIQTRLKDPRSIIEKMRRRGFPLTLESMEENVFDIAGIRAVCSFVDDVYFVANCLRNQDDIRILQIKDYISDPKDNGYRSLHMIIEIPIFLAAEKRVMKVEVQLRTIAMEFWANLDHKMRYKKNIDPEVEKKIENELLECALLSANLDQRMQRVRNIIESGLMPASSQIPGQESFEKITLDTDMKEVDIPDEDIPDEDDASWE